MQIAYNVFNQNDTIQFSGDFLTAAINYVADLGLASIVTPINVGPNWDTELEGVTPFRQVDSHYGCVAISNDNIDQVYVEGNEFNVIQGVVTPNNVWTDGHTTVGVEIVGNQAFIFFSEN